MQLDLDFGDDFDDSIEIDSIATPKPEGPKITSTLAAVGRITWKVSLVLVISGCAIGNLFHGVSDSPLIVEGAGIAAREANNFLLNLLLD